MTENVVKKPTYTLGSQVVFQRDDKFNIGTIDGAVNNANNGWIYSLAEFDEHIDEECVLYIYDKLKTNWRKTPSKEARLRRLG